MDHDHFGDSEEAVLLEEVDHQENDHSPSHERRQRNSQSENPDDWTNTLPGTSLPVDGYSSRSRAHDEYRFSSSESWLYCQRSLPQALAIGLTVVLKWIEGPQPPRPFKISHTGPSLARRWRGSRRLQKLSIFIVLVSSFLYVLAFVVVLALGNSRCEVKGYGAPLRLSCVDRLWAGASECGIDGQTCRPFHNTSFAFRCPADCSRVRVLEPYTIGGQEINYRTLVVGGSTNKTRAGSKHVYRGDSFLCPAAIHAGAVPDLAGGAGVIVLMGEQSNFPSSSANGIDSIAFTPAFPLSFTFSQEAQSSSSLWLGCKDPRWVLLGLTILYNVTISIFSQSAAIFYTAISASAYSCVALAMDAPEPSNYFKVVSLAFQGLLPATFIAYVIYRTSVKRTLHGLYGTADQTILWLGSFWVGALDNHTFDKLPVQRLIPHDIAAEPGGIVVLIVILAFLVVGGAGHVWAFWLEGRLPKYLLLYLCMGAGLGLLVSIPNLNLRIHHYIVALLLLPGTALQTRPSLIYQGLLVGLFINGVARWGFASILEVSEDLFQKGLSGPPPHLQAPQILGDNITFSWNNVSAGYDSLSIVVNDVERFRGYEDHNSHSFSWIREQLNEPAYFRFAGVRYRAVEGVMIGDYSKPGTWLPDGSWIPIIENTDQ